LKQFQRDIDSFVENTAGNGPAQNNQNDQQIAIPITLEEVEYVLKHVRTKQHLDLIILIQISQIHNTTKFIHVNSPSM